MNKENGMIEKVPVRELWANEAHEFTPWLAKNADKLGKVLELDLEHQRTEVPVGRYSADLLFRDSSGQLVVVENMFGATDHDHLGKLITYMAGLDAHYAVLIAEDIRPEHQSALNHLNTTSGDEFGFFGIIVEAYRIDNSRPAPLLRMAVHPDNWRRSVRATQSTTPTQQRSLRFWSELLDRIQTAYPDWTQSKPSKDSWISLPSASSSVATYRSAFCRPTGAYRVRVEVYINTREKATTKEVFDYLHDEKQLIERAIREESERDRQDDRQESRISFYFPSNMRVSEEERWPEVQQWLVEVLRKVRETFDPHIEHCEMMLEAGVDPSTTDSARKRSWWSRLGFRRRSTVN